MTIPGFPGAPPLARVKGAAAKALPKGLPVTGQLKFQHYGLAMRFAVDIGGLSIGHWSSCENLKVTFNTEKVTSGGNYYSQILLPKDISYERITLKRAMIKGGSDELRKWLRKVAVEWVNGDPDRGRYTGASGDITLLDVTGKEVQKWHLEGIYPVSWSGPQLDAKRSDIAYETLVIEHEGFL
jgi:phage tail-like protein